MIFVVQKSGPFGINGQCDKNLKINETKPIQSLPQPFFICRLETIELSNQKPLILGLMFQNNILTRSVRHNPAAALILDKMKIESIFSMINNLAELAVSILIINAS